MLCNEELCEKQAIKVSVIIPAYNVEKYINQCLESVCTQTYSNLEIIIVYDVSEDGTLLICREWEHKDSRVKILVNDHRNGLGAARNKGLRHAVGKYITYLDSDDWYASDFVEGLLRVIEKTKANYVSYTGINWVTDGKAERRYSMPAGIYESYTERAIVLLKDNPAAWKKIYNRQWLISNDLFQPEIYHYEDWGYNIPLVLSASKIVLVPEAGVYYRVNREGCLSNDELTRLIRDFKNSIEFGIREVEKRNLLHEHRVTILIYFYNDYCIRKEQAIHENNEEVLKMLESLRKEIVGEKLGFKDYGGTDRHIAFGSFSCRWIAQKTGIYKENLEYYGFSSLISAMTLSGHSDISHENDFRKNQVRQDIEGSFLQELLALNCKTVLFLDFLEEKNDIIQDINNNYITDSEAYDGVKNKKENNVQKISYNSESFFELWEQKCTNFIDILKEKKEMVEIVLIKNRLSLRFGDLYHTDEFPEQHKKREINDKIIKLEKTFLQRCMENSINVLEIDLPEKYKFTDCKFKYGCETEYMNEFLYTYIGIKIFKKMYERMEKD